MKNSIFQLGIETTRRCNFNCNFCSRGAAENVDMTTEIVDKILDEIQDIYVEGIRLNGGEPFLNPEIIVYLVEKIIERKIEVGSLCVFTNGSILNQDIAEAFRKFIDYSNNMQPTKDHWRYDNLISYYPEIIGKKVAIVISTVDHPQVDCGETVRYYKEHISSDLCYVGVQDNKPNKLSVTLEGRAKDNVIRYKEWSPRTIHDEYDILARSDDGTVATHKAISVSANGNVFVGCLRSFKNIDTKDKLFNILDCKSDFMERLIAFCWTHPINEKMNNFIEIYQGSKLFAENGISNKYCLYKDSLEAGEIVCKLISEYEKTFREAHKIFPNISHERCTIAAVAIFTMKFHINGKASLRQSYIDFMMIFGFDENDIRNFMQPDYCKYIIQESNRINKQKQNQEGN